MLKDPEEVVRVSEVPTEAPAIYEEIAKLIG
jgi:hypothetical protein